MKFLTVVFVLAIISTIVAVLLFPLVMNGVTRIDVVSGNGDASRVVLSLNLPKREVMSGILIISVSILAGCGVSAIGHDAYIYGFRWEKRNKDKPGSEF